MWEMVNAVEIIVVKGEIAHYDFKRHQHVPACGKWLSYLFNSMFSKLSTAELWWEWIK